MSRKSEIFDLQADFTELAVDLERERARTRAAEREGDYWKNLFYESQGPTEPPEPTLRDVAEKYLRDAWEGPTKTEELLAAALDILRTTPPTATNITGGSFTTANHPRVKSR